MENIEKTENTGKSYCLVMRWWYRYKSEPIPSSSMCFEAPDDDKAVEMVHRLVDLFKWELRPTLCELIDDTYRTVLEYEPWVDETYKAMYDAEYNEG